MKLIPTPYVKYKFLNSLFTGLSVGSVFVIYEPLNPSVFSLGGILLAIGMLIVAKFYEVLLNVEKYFLIALLVELVMLFLILYFLIKPYSYHTALLIYGGYQLTFIFGAYLVRAETLIVHKKKLLTIVDVAKQYGYLSGMGVSYLFYKTAEFFSVSDKKEQVYDLHFLLLAVELAVIIYFIKSFKKRPRKLS